MAEIKDRMEFDPRDVLSLPDLMLKLLDYSIERHGVEPDYRDLVIERMHNNAELHVVKFVIIK